MQQKADMAYRYLFFVIILLLTNSLQSQTIISAGTYSAEDFTGPSLIISANEGLSGFSSSDAFISLTFTVNESTYNFDASNNYHMERDLPTSSWLAKNIWTDAWKSLACYRQ
mgnify:CR=1 FL=1